MLITKQLMVVIDFQSMEKAKQNKTLIGTKNCTHIFQTIF